MQNRGMRLFLNRHLELRVYIWIVMILVLIVKFSLFASQNRVLLEKLIASELVQKFPAFYGNWRFVMGLTSVRHMPLSWARSIQSMLPIPIREDPSKYYPSIYAWVFQVLSIPQVSPPNYCLHLSSPHTCYMPCLSHSSRFNHPNNILWEVQLPQQTTRMCTHPNIHKHTWTSSDVKTHNQTDHILIDRRLHSSIVDVWFFRGAECDADHCLVFPKVMERFVVSKQAMLTLMWKDLCELDVRKLFQIRAANRFAALENLKKWYRGHKQCLENINKNNKTSAKKSLGLYELKQLKTCFDEDVHGF